MNNDQVVYPEDLHQVDPQQLRAEARMKEFRLRKLVDVTRFWPDLTVEHIQAAKRVAEAEQKVRNAQEELNAVKREVFNTNSRW
jgi:hypothetical protein